MKITATRRGIHNDRGVALLITLLVTTLLMALVFEFAYGTRVSLRAAVNFRDSQQAYFLARSGVNFAGKFLADLLKQGKKHDFLEQPDCDTLLSDTIPGAPPVRVCWGDEAGKIKIGPGSVNPSTRAWFRNLLYETQVSQEVDGRLFDQQGFKIDLLSKLHQVINDEEFGKIHKFVTAYPPPGPGAINVNTASEEVLRSVLRTTQTTADFILMKRRDGPIQELAGTDINNSSFTTTSNVFRVNSYATVGGYTKHVEAVIQRTTGGFSIPYWSIL